jgi:hypothetical protein
MIGCGTRVTDEVRPGMMCGLCVPCCVADGRGHAAVYRQSKGARGVRAGVVGRGRGDQPGDGGLGKLDGSALWGQDVLGCVGDLCSWSGACTLRGGAFGQEVVQPMLHLKGWGAS